MKILLIQAKNFKNWNWTSPVVRYFTLTITFTLSLSHTFWPGLQLHFELYVLTQTGTLSKYIDHLEIISRCPNINLEIKLYDFVNGFKSHLKEVLLLQKSVNYKIVVFCVKLKGSTSTKNDRLFKQIKQLPPVKELNCPGRPSEVTSRDIKTQYQNKTTGRTSC